MNRKSLFKIVFAPETVSHLKWIDRKFHSQLREEIHDQLSSQPDLVARNRKPLSQPALFEATWELRCGPENRFRVLYEIDEEKKVVWILAVGVKKGNQLTIGGEELEL